MEGKDTKTLDLPREYLKIQENGRISIPLRFREFLGWQDGDQIMVEVYKGRILIENLKEREKPAQERLK